MMDVRNKVAIVTGASSGIGLATARLLAEKGSKVVLVSRSKEKLEELSRGIPGSFVAPADMTIMPEIKRMVEVAQDHFGGIDILINCAGQGYDAPIEKTKIGTLQYIFDLDVIGPLVAMQQVIPLMRRQGGGAIINISSGTALMYLPYMGGYSALKRALANISLTAREELKRDKIIVSVVYPFITLTQFEANTIKDSVPEEEGEQPSRRSPDSAEYVAQKILEAIEGEEPEIFAHDWMRQ